MTALDVYSWWFFTFCCLFICCISRDKRKRDEGDSSDRTKEGKKSKEVLSLFVLIKPLEPNLSLYTLANIFRTTD